MVDWMRENETSPAPDYTVSPEIRDTLKDSANYLGWSIIDRATEGPLEVERRDHRRMVGPALRVTRRSVHHDILCHPGEVR